MTGIVPALRGHRAFTTRGHQQSIRGLSGSAVPNSAAPCQEGHGARDVQTTPGCPCISPIKKIRIHETTLAFQLAGSSCPRNATA